MCGFADARQANAGTPYVSRTTSGAQMRIAASDQTQRMRIRRCARGNFEIHQLQQSLDVVKTGHAWDEFDVAVLSSLGSLANHEPRHVHVETTGGKLIGRLDLRTRQGMEGWQPDRKLLRVIEDLEREGRL